MNLIDIIKNIGKEGICKGNEFNSLIPNFPQLLGNEFLLSVKWKDIVREIKSLEEIEYFIKGLHITEIKYREIIGDSFGFGSTTSTFRILNNLEKTDYELSIKLKKWIKDNGGNYYIK
jgi:hypothetical protein